MGRRTRVWVVVAAVLAVGAFAAPATAQEGFTLEECVGSIAANSGFALSDAQRAELAAMNVTGDTLVKEVLEALFDGTDDPEFVVADDETLAEICSIYGVNVLPTRFDRNGNGNGDGNGVPPTEVRGTKITRGLPVTGTDAIVLALIGAGLLGLGYVALRRTRDQAA
jgi:LPXTG-motif cell wall-anchored protein